MAYPQCVALGIGPAARGNTKRSPQSGLSGVLGVSAQSPECEALGNCARGVMRVPRSGISMAGGPDGCGRDRIHQGGAGKCPECEALGNYTATRGAAFSAKRNKQRGVGWEARSVFREAE